METTWAKRGCSVLTTATFFECHKVLGCCWNGFITPDSKIPLSLKCRMNELFAEFPGSVSAESHFFMHLIGNSSAIISWPSRLVMTYGRIILRFREQCFLCVSPSWVFNLKRRQSQSALCSLFPSDSNRKHNHRVAHVVGQTVQVQGTVAPHVRKEPKLDRANSTENIVPVEESLKRMLFQLFLTSKAGAPFSEATFSDLPEWEG